MATAPAMQLPLRMAESRHSRSRSIWGCGGGATPERGAEAAARRANATGQPHYNTARPLCCCGRLARSEPPADSGCLCMRPCCVATSAIRPATGASCAFVAPPNCCRRLPAPRLSRKRSQLSQSSRCCGCGGGGCCCRSSRLHVVGVKSDSSIEQNLLQFGAAALPLRERQRRNVAPSRFVDRTSGSSSSAAAAAALEPLP